MAPGAVLSLPAAELRRRARALEWLLLDVDGVLTDGALYYSTAGEDVLRFHIRDGLALKLAQQGGLRVGILSGRDSDALRRRAGELGIETLVLGRSDKAPAFAELLESAAARPEQFAFLGDDLQDLPVLQRCGLSLAPADAAPEVQEAVDVVLERGGGQAVVREAVELLLRARGQWGEVTAQFRHIDTEAG